MSHTPTKFNFTPLARCPPLALKRMLAFENRKKVRLALVDKYLDNFSQLLHYLSINSLFISLHNSIVDPIISFWIRAKSKTRPRHFLDPVILRPRHFSAIQTRPHHFDAFFISQYERANIRVIFHTQA